MDIIRDARPSFIEEEILKLFSSIVDKELPEASIILLFGSRARGRSGEDSDLDLAIVIDVPVIDKALWDKLWAIKWRVLESLNSEEFPLSLMPITLTDFKAGGSGIIREIKREGIVVWKRN
jgi:predicted nucleotidyltransferase